METFLILALAALCVIVPFWMAQIYGLVAWVSPLHLLAYFSFFGFFLKVAAYAMLPDLAFYKGFVGQPGALLVGAIYLALFIFALCVGYRVACRTASRSDNVIAARLVAAGIGGGSLLFWFALAAAALTALAIMHARGAVGFDTALLSAVNSAKQINVNADGVGATLAGLKTFFVVPKFVFVLLFALGIVSGRRRVWAMTGIIGLVLVFVALLSGDRFELVELFMLGAATYLILGGSPGARSIALGCVVLCLLGTVSGVMTQLRLGESPSGWAVFLGQVVGSTYFLDINAAVMVTHQVDTQQMLLGQSYLWWTFGWVPRAIWVDKPAIDLGVFFKREVMGLYTGGAFNVTGPGEAFINFGWGGLGVGLALGWVYRKGEAFLLSASAAIRYGAFLFYPVLFYQFVQATLQSSFSAFIVGAAAQLVLLVLMIRLCVVRYGLWLRPRSSNAHRSQLYVA